MGNLHQHLAVLNDLENRARKVLEESVKAWGKQELFQGSQRTLKMFDEDRKKEEAGAAKYQELTTTVIERLKYIAPFMVENLDAQFQRELANALATSDLVLPSGDVIKNVPVTALMYFEKFWSKVRQDLNGMPTIDTKKRWEPDTQAALEGVLRTVDPERATKSEMQKVVIQMAKATEKHPEQVSLHDKQIAVGTYEDQYQTGAMTPAAKHAVLQYIDDMITAIRKARNEANETAVDPSKKCGQSMVRGLLEAARSA